MVPAVADRRAVPATWPTDGRDGGVPDPATVGSGHDPDRHRGRLPARAGRDPAQHAGRLRLQPPGHRRPQRLRTQTLFLGPAERADVIVDFSGAPPGRRSSSTTTRRRRSRPSTRATTTTRATRTRPTTGRRAADAAGLRPQHPDRSCRSRSSRRRHGAAVQPGRAATRPCPRRLRRRPARAHRPAGRLQRRPTARPIPATPTSTNPGHIR